MDSNASALSPTRGKLIALQWHVAQKGSVQNTESLSDQEEAKATAAASVAGQKALAEFMKASGQPITFVETREIWNDMCSTNNGSFPRLEKIFGDLSKKSLSRTLKMRSSSKSLTEDTSKNPEVSHKSSHLESSMEILTKSLTNLSRLETSHKSSICETEEISNTNEDDEEDDLSEREDVEQGGVMVSVSGIVDQEISKLSNKELEHFVQDLAKGIKDTYSIRTQDDMSELKFIVGTMMFLWLAVASIAIAGYFYSDNTKIGTFTMVTLRSILMESFILFGAELVWECFLSWIVLRYNIKINYTRKLGNLLKVPKYFVADLLPNYASTALSMTSALSINQTLFCAMYYRRSRETVPFFSYVFLSQDRREDRPDTLIFQVTEDVLRFAIYFPFKLLVVDLIEKPAIIFIPIAVNNIGDGLAEPIGVAFGKHKYSTTALYYSKLFKLGSEHYFKCTYVQISEATAAGSLRFNSNGQRANSSTEILPARTRGAPVSISPH